MSEMISNQMMTGTTTAKQEKYEKKMAKYAANKARKEQKEKKMANSKQKRWLLPNEKFAIAYGNFANIYNEAKAYSKHIGLNMFDAESSYTFATDMVLYSSTKEIDAYINRMLNRYCKKNKQAYYEMIMSVLCMLEIYNYLQDEEMIMFFRNWQYKLQYSEEFYKPYITESEMSDYWRLY